ncbi:AAA family ATPase [Albibacterium bauzanense]|uniref:NadR type nicotinamide-nucleotide adenylyltransferase n=1 Tax=Albibacterium bauzanense TaxID=653929 RepID=A0A4R1M0L4_9SPHI|nr:ATP-binding protein [Albibacterium bauzanense]TCK83173.1 NadR type nicotinamide-nucleotide adenylyltransferase [Albibacterium bauzanense]
MGANKIIKIAIVGPESTGKSSLTKQLADYFETLLVPEFAREYCKDLHRNYTLEDEINIFHGQIASEKRIIKSAKKDFIFCDTMVLTVKIWCDHLFGSTPKEVLKGIAEQSYDLYLLMDIDLPWQEDELRDFPTLREHFMEIWHQELQALSANYKIVSGTGDQRLLNAKDIVQQFLRENSKSV